MFTSIKNGTTPLWMRILVLLAGVLLGLGLSWLWSRSRQTANKPSTPNPQNPAPASVLYLSPTGGEAQLWVMELETRQARQLTDFAGEVTGFSPAPDGSAVTVTLRSPAGNSSLQMVDLRSGGTSTLVDCGSARCESPAWSITESVAFIRSQSENPAEDGLWVIDAFAPDRDPVLLRQGNLSSPTWSPEGSLLAVLDHDASLIRLIDPATEDENVLPTSMGVMGAWSPETGGFVFVDLELSFEPIGRLFRVDFISGNIIALEPEGYDEADFSGLAWSPRGDRIAASVRRSGEGQGRQLVLFDPDGENLEVLAGDLDAVYGGARWNDEGVMLTFQRFDLNAADEGPSIMLWREGAGVELLVEHGFLPAFLY